jgi:hypothetical protein
VIAVCAQEKIVRWAREMHILFLQSLPRSSGAQVKELTFAVGAFGVKHRFNASTLAPTLRHFEKGGKNHKKHRRTDDLDIIAPAVALPYDVAKRDQEG